MERKLTNFRLEPELLAGLARVKERIGIPQTEQVRRAIRAWLELQGEVIGPKKPDRQRAATRRRS